MAWFETDDLWVNPALVETIELLYCNDSQEYACALTCTSGEQYFSPGFDTEEKARAWLAKYNIT